MLEDLTPETGLIRPPAIARGEAIGVVAPSYSPREGHLMRGAKALERAGYEVILDPDILEMRRFTRRQDERRAARHVFDPGGGKERVISG